MCVAALDVVDGFGCERSSFVAARRHQPLHSQASSDLDWENVVFHSQLQHQRLVSRDLGVARHFQFLLHTHCLGSYFSYRVNLPLSSSERKFNFLPNVGALAIRWRFCNLDLSNIVCISSGVGLAVTCWSVFAYQRSKNNRSPSLSFADVNFRLTTLANLSLLVVKSYLVGVTSNISSSADDIFLFVLFLITFSATSLFGLVQLVKLWSRRNDLLENVRHPKVFVSLIASC